MFLEDLHRLGFLILFEASLRQVLAYPRYLYQQTLVFLILFEAAYGRVLFILSTIHHYTSYCGFLFIVWDSEVFDAFWGFFTTGSCSSSEYSDIFDAFLRCFAVGSCSSSGSSEPVSTGLGVFDAFLGCFISCSCSSSVSSESISTSSGNFGAFFRLWGLFNFFPYLFRLLFFLTWIIDGSWYFFRFIWFG